MISPDKLLDYFCALLNLRPDQISKLTIILLVLIIAIQLLGYLLNLGIQIFLKRIDVQKEFSAVNYQKILQVYEEIYACIKNIYSNVLVGATYQDVITSVNALRLIIRNNDLFISSKMSNLINITVDSLLVFAQSKNNKNNSEVIAAMNKIKKEYKKHDNY